MGSKNGLCPVPFLQENLFPPEGGYIDGRLCDTITLPTGKEVSCCLPCPQAQWRYSEGFLDRTEVSNWINVGLVPFTAFMLISFALLPTKWTHRHFLSVCLSLAILSMQVGFIIPLGAKPEQCYNGITPNDMRSDLTCAFTGAFILFGGWGVIIWSFFRALSLHLQVCWDIVTGKVYFYCTLIGGWAIPAVGLVVALTLTGVSYRFGNVCHINHDLGLEDFWGPLMAFAAIALILQFMTLGYCVHVYVKSVMDKDASTGHSSSLPSYSASVRTITARQAYKRVRRVVYLQWRGVAVVLTIIGNVIFFAVVFVSMDDAAYTSPENLKRAEEWIACLAMTSGDQNQCLEQASSLGPNEATVLAVLILLSLTAMWNFLFVFRFSMVLGWVDLFKRHISHRHEFISADALPNSPTPRSYEMINPRQNALKSPEPLLSRSPTGLSTSTMRFSGGKSTEAPEYVNYTSPTMSFSTPRPQTSSWGRDWDPRSTYARGGGY